LPSSPFLASRVEAVSASSSTTAACFPLHRAGRQRWPCARHVRKEARLSRDDGVRVRAQATALTVTGGEVTMRASERRISRFLFSHKFRVADRRDRTYGHWPQMQEFYIIRIRCNSCRKGTICTIHIYINLDLNRWNLKASSPFGT
jgi:hypothetical protein